MKKLQVKRQSNKLRWILLFTGVILSASFLAYKALVRPADIALVAEPMPKCTSKIASFSTVGSCGDRGLFVERVDYTCQEPGRVAYEGGSGSCIDPVVAFEHARAFCGESCVTPTQSAFPRPSCVPLPNPCPTGAQCKPSLPLASGQVYCPQTTTGPRPSPTPSSAIPANCTSWFDGCNTCDVIDGKTTRCTKKACKPGQSEESKCLAYNNQTPTPTPSPTPSPSLPPGCIDIPSPRWCISQIIGRKCRPSRIECVEPPPTPTPQPTLQPGCFETQVECIQAPCDPIIVCPIYSSSPPSPEICGQAITRAYNSQTDECQDFSTTCLPPGWVESNTCVPPTKDHIAPRFDGGPITTTSPSSIPSPTFLELVTSAIQTVTDFFTNLVTPSP